jgi:hypothetical protein
LHQRAALPGDKLGCAKVDILDDAVVVEEDVWDFG